MWSEEWDKKIQAAAGNNQPEFQEKSWDQMESLLEKHLPAEKKRRRLFILFFTLLTTAALVFLIVQQRTSRPNRTSTARTEQTPGATIPLANTDKNNVPAASEAPAASTSKSALVQVPESLIDPPPVTGHKAGSIHGTARIASQQKPTVQKQSITGTATEKLRKQAATIQKNPAVRQFAEEENSETKATDAGNTNGTVDNSIITQTEQAGAVSNTPDSSAADKPAEEKTTDSTTAAKPEKSADKTGRPQQSFSKRLGITASLGADVNGVRLSKLNNAKTVWGVGLSYDISRRITLRTGFFASRKIYVADPSDYHPPYNFWNYYPNLQKIDANCMVYEIPLSVIYNGGNTSKNHWFVSAGLSSLIMKSEEYGYSYKDASGQPRYYTRSLYNKNQHLFSTLQLSGGYSFRLSSRASLLAEPYLKLPLSGIGYGKVRLYSAGMMLTAIVKPFAKN